MEAARGRISVVCLRGWYGRDLLLDGGLEGPELVVAMNAGLSAFPEWEPSLLFVLASGAPLFVTDLTEEAAVQARALVADAVRKLPKGPTCAGPGHWDVSEVEANDPHHQPPSRPWMTMTRMLQQLARMLQQRMLQQRMLRRPWH